MNLTVGPLPPSVYWRRRAIVLGGLLLVILLVTYACGGPGTSNASNQQSSKPPAAAPTPSDVASSLPSMFPSAGSDQAASASVPVMPSVSASVPLSPSASVTNGVATCTDAQIQVTPVISSTSSTTSRLEVGGTYDLKLKIRNVSDVTCRRDVGAIPEELLIARGTTKIWSSDDCEPSKGIAHDVRTFGPNIEIYAEVTWSSYLDTAVSCEKSKSPAAAGEYTLTGRVGSKKATVSFKIG